MSLSRNWFNQCPYDERGEPSFLGKAYTCCYFYLYTLQSSVQQEPMANEATAVTSDDPVTCSQNDPNGKTFHPVDCASGAL